MSLAQDLQKAAGMLEIVAEGLTTLQKMTGTGGPAAAEALVAIDAGLAAIAKGIAGDLTPDQVREQIANLDTDIAGNNAAADVKLENKFGVHPDEDPPKPAA